MKEIVSCLICFVLLSATGISQPKVYIAPMDEGFDSFLAAALIDNKVPVKITVEECSASYIITGHSVKGQNKWYDTVFGAERDRNQGSIKLLKVSDKSIVWAGAAGDRSIWWGALKSGGQKKVANRLARELKKGYFNRTLESENVDRCSQTSSTNSTFNTSASSGPKSGEHQSSPVGISNSSNIQITSTPDGAEIVINGNVVGNTPSSLLLKPGEHTVIVRKAGYRKWERFIRVPKEGNVSLDASLLKY